MLLIATGAVPQRLALTSGDLPGVHYLRDKAECEQIRHEIASGAKRAIVLGASFLGMEIAMSLIDLGLDVTIVGEPSSRDYDFSDISIRANQEQGYALVKETLVKETLVKAADRRSGTSPIIDPLLRSIPSFGEGDRLVQMGPAPRRVTKRRQQL